MFFTLLDIVIPVIAIALLGYLVGKRQTTPPQMDFINGVNINVFCPALVFSALTMHPVDLASSWALVAAGTLIILLPGALLLFLRPQGIQQPAFLIAGMFRNTGNIGIPLMMLAYGRENLGDIVILFVLSNCLHFSLGLFMLSGNQDRWLWLKSPNVWAAVLGVLCAPYSDALPGFLSTSIEMVGQITIPLMIFSLGIRLSQDKISNIGLAFKTNVIYLFAGLISIPIVLWLLPLTPEWSRMIVLSGMLPPAVLNFLLCERYQMAPEIVASVVLLGNVISVFTIPLVIWFTLVAI